MTIFLVQIGPKKTIFLKGLLIFFSTTELQHKLLILIESTNIFHWKSTKKKESECDLCGEIWAK